MKNQKHQTEEEMNKKELSSEDGGRKRVIVNLYENHDIPSEVELTKMQDIIIGCDENGYRGMQIKAVTLPDVLFSPSGKGVHQRTSRAALGLLLHSGTAFQYGQDYITIKLADADGNETTTKILCKVPSPLEGPTKQLYELALRLREVSAWQVKLMKGREKPSLRIDHAMQAYVLSQHALLLLWIAGALDRFSAQVEISRRAKLEDTTERKALQNIKRELGSLTRQKAVESKVPDATYFYQSALPIVEQARVLCDAAVNDKTLLNVGMVDEKLKSVDAAVAALKQKYSAASASADNLYLMSFVDHLLVNAKAVFDDPEKRKDDDPERQSNWRQMQDVLLIEDRIYISGAVDVDSVWNSISGSIAGALSAGEHPSEPIGAMLYSLALVELAAEITSKL